MALQSVLSAAEQAFHVTRAQIDIRLEEEVPSGRVHGLLVIKNSNEFAQMSQPERSRALWEKLRQNAGAESTNVGVVILLSENEVTEGGH